MAMKNQGRVRGAILANVCFATALLILIIYSMATNDQCDSLNDDGSCRESDLSVFTSGMRLAFVAFMLLACIQYCRLWDVYKAVVEDEKSPSKVGMKYINDVMHMGDEDLARIS